MEKAAVKMRMDFPLIRQLEAISFRAWPATKVSYNGTWLVRLTPQHSSKRLNSVNPLDPGDNARIPERIEALRQFYSKNGQSAVSGSSLSEAPVFRLSPLAPPELEKYLEEHGWQNIGITHVMIRDLPDSLSDSLAINDAADWNAFKIRQETDICKFAAISMLTHKKKTEKEPAENLNASVALVKVIKQITLPKTMLVFKLGDEAIASALIVHDGRWSGLLDIAVRPDCQGQGIGHKLIRQCLHIAVQQGSEKIWLQVEQSNIIALSLYEKLGFNHAYQYHYRIKQSKE